jgi:hypothetical protein
LGQFPKVAESFPKTDLSQISFVARQCQVLFRSLEVDILFEDAEEASDIVEAVLGELSNFHDTFGYYAQAVDHTTSTLPDGWENRLIEICNSNTNYISGMCLEIHDLLVSKLYAGRTKDIEFFHAAVAIGLVSHKVLLERLGKTPLDVKSKERIAASIQKGFSQ